MTHPNHALAERFFAALSAGDLSDDLLTPDMQAWTVSSGQWTDKARYQGGVRLLQSMFPARYTFTVDSLISEDDRVAAEVHAEGLFEDGVRFANTYVFILTIRDGRIAKVAEHFNTLPVREVLGPRIQAKLAGTA